MCGQLATAQDIRLTRIEAHHQPMNAILAALMSVSRPKSNITSTSPSTPAHPKEVLLTGIRSLPVSSRCYDSRARQGLAQGQESGKGGATTALACSEVHDEACDIRTRVLGGVVRVSDQ